MRTTTYTVPDGKHVLTAISAADDAGTKSAFYTYDASGNMLTRPVSPSDSQTMTWDAEGHIATSVDAGGTTSYVYDANGNRLLRIDSAGKTLYLPNQELRFDASAGMKTATRYYTHGDLTVATRSGGKLTWLSGDHHGTAEITVDAVTQATAVRRETPF